jgi:hypothetical protein
MAQSNLADQSTGSEVVDKQKAAALAVATFSFVTGQRAKAENLAMLAAYFEAARMLQIAGLTQAGLHAIAQEGLRSGGPRDVEQFRAQFQRCNRHRCAEFR